MCINKNYKCEKNDSIALYNPLSRSYFKMWEIIKDFDSAKLHRVRLHETPTIFTDYYGPG